MHLAQKLKKDMSETEGSLHSFTTVYLSVNLFLCMLMLLMIHYFLNLRIHVFHQFGNILRKKKKNLCKYCLSPNLYCLFLELQLYVYYIISFNFFFIFFHLLASLRQVLSNFFRPVFQVTNCLFCL